MTTNSKTNEPISGGKKTPIFELYDPMVVDLYEVHDRLWYEYFCPKVPHDKKMKLFMQEQLNSVGEEINKTSRAMKTPQQQVEIVTSNKQFDMDEYGPDSKRPIYVEVMDPIKPKKGAKASPKRSGKIEVEDDDDLMGDYKEDKRDADKSKARKHEADEDLMGDDDDLMGGDKPKRKSTSRPKKEGKSNYDTIAELAAKGKNRDQIVEITGLPRKTVTDNLWRWNKNKGGKK